MNKIDVEKGFLENLDYLKQLVKLINAKPVSTFDKNLTYEVIYADTYVESIIPKIEDTKLVAMLGDIKTALDLVVFMVTHDIRSLAFDMKQIGKDLEDATGYIKLYLVDSFGSDYWKEHCSDITNTIKEVYSL